MENAAIAIHALLLNRSREASGNIIVAALASLPSSLPSSASFIGKTDGSNIEKIENTIDINIKGEIENENEKRLMSDVVNYNNLNDKNRSNNNESEMVRKLMKIVSTPPVGKDFNNEYFSIQSTAKVSSSNLVRLMAAKVLDSWYSTGGGISADLLSAEDKPGDTDADTDAG